MPKSAREKKRFGYKRQMDNNDAMRQHQKSQKAQKMNLEAKVQAGKLEPEHINSGLQERVQQLEAIKAFYEKRFGNYEELVRAEQEATKRTINAPKIQDADSMNNVQNTTTATFLPLGPAEHKPEAQDLDQHNDDSDSLSDDPGPPVRSRFFSHYAAKTTRRRPSITDEDVKKYFPKEHSHGRLPPVDPSS
ncbi:uncharacterized protein N0V89_003836 [Didymosphaeria variabile]|uniref:Uncharacterized protein n=1 Tax=Didymosphaeria variabile TaxID=1932322 RepID=A0A9W8XND2_9PLEO|nr:uncharacterized protein N0V89_003836 [Didymosphaeria variabile]KAJ4355815.1 hypothetical protein N0V89_003836 [Didymosphaeria variabile]